MSARLDKIGAEREKARRKRDEWDARFKELDRKYTEQENTEIHEMVRAESLTPAQLAVLLQMAKDTPPSPERLAAAMGRPAPDVAMEKGSDSMKEETDDED